MFLHDLQKWDNGKTTVYAVQSIYQCTCETPTSCDFGNVQFSFFFLSLLHLPESLGVLI